jgi:hypothetical protein
MWSLIAANDTVGLDRHVALMLQMDRGYGNLTAADLVDAIRFQQGELWHYQGQGFHIGMLFLYSRERQRWILAQMGFFGTVQPAQALDINVLRGRDFFQAHGVSSLLAVRPKTMDFQPLLTYYDLCLTHPHLQITVVAQTDEKTIWDISYVP